MKYFAAFLKMQDVEKNRDLRPQHLAFLDANRANIFARGPFKDGAGGLVIYTAETLDEAAALAAADPYVVQGARSLEIHEWDVKLKA
jgi:uncharacterized protein